MKYFLLIIILAKASSAIAQADLFSNNNMPGVIAGVEVYDVSGKPIPNRRQAKPEGPSMLNEHFEKGTVKFKNGQQFKDVLLNLSLLDNQLYFKKDSTEMIFIIPVEQFVLPVADEGKTRTILFKAGYPAIKNQTNKTFYQVLTDSGKIELLKYQFKTIYEHYIYGEQTKNEYKTEHRYFIYNGTTGQISEIGTNVKSLKKALPGYEGEIDKFSLQNQVKSNREDEMKFLVEHLNKQL